LPIPNHKIEGQDRTFAYVRHLTFDVLPADGRTIFIFNATQGNHITAALRGPDDVRSYLIRVFNRYIVPEWGAARADVDANGLVQLNVGVEQGGIILLEPLNEDTDIELILPDENTLPPPIREGKRPPDMEFLLP
jgi:hypothetical protein